MEIIKILKKRFNSNMHRHEDVLWGDIEGVLKNNDYLLEIISKMEETSGEPDIIIFEDEIYFVDFSKESPKSRRSLCYDKEARVKRKKFPPESSSEEMAHLIGTRLIDERMYKYIQTLENIDLKSSSWIYTPEEIRKLGGALFCNTKFERVFTYYNGADAYYASRGFRTMINLTDFIIKNKRKG